MAPAERPVRRPKRTVALAGLVVVVAAVFVVENSQRVKVRLWFVTGHPRLIWVLLVALAAGAVVGFVAGRAGRRKSRS